MKAVLARCSCKHPNDNRFAVSTTAAPWRSEGSSRCDTCRIWTSTSLKAAFVRAPQYHLTNGAAVSSLTAVHGCQSESGTATGEALSADQPVHSISSLGQWSHAACVL